MEKERKERKYLYDIVLSHPNLYCIILVIVACVMVNIFFPNIKEEKIEHYTNMYEDLKQIAQEIKENNGLYNFRNALGYVYEYEVSHNEAGYICKVKYSKEKGDGFPITIHLNFDENFEFIDSNPDLNSKDALIDFVQRTSFGDRIPEWICTVITLCVISLIFLIMSFLHKKFSQKRAAKPKTIETNS